MIARRALFAALLVAVVCGAPAATAQATNYSDIWWDPAEPGWGITIADHETQLFAVWYTYQFNGTPVWFVLPGGAFSADRRQFTGDLYQTAGPAFDVAFDPRQVAVAKIGSATLDFAPTGQAPGIALFTYRVGLVARTRQIRRQPFGDAAPRWGADATDLWWKADEPGWGLALAQHGNTVFGAWFVYGHDGLPLFVVMPNGTFSEPSRFSGPLYTTRGTYNVFASFDWQDPEVFLAGSATVTLSGAAGPAQTATVTTTIHGHTQTRTLGRQPFGRAAPTGP